MKYKVARVMFSDSHHLSSNAVYEDSPFFCKLFYTLTSDHIPTLRNVS